MEITRGTTFTTENGHAARVTYVGQTHAAVRITIRKRQIVRQLFALDRIRALVDKQESR